MSFGERHSVGLQRDGTVVAAGQNTYGQCNVSEWRDVIAVSAGSEHTIGLRADGTVLCAGTKHSEIEKWTNIKSIASVQRVALGVREDGTVVKVGYRTMKDSFPELDEWRDIASITVVNSYLFGLRNDGTIVTTDPNAKEMTKWTDVVKIARVRGNYTALRADGTVRSTKYTDLDWRNIIDVAAGPDSVIGLRADGTAVYQKKKMYFNPPEVSPLVDVVAQWSDLIAVGILNDRTDRDIPIGLKSDGTIVSSKRVSEQYYSNWKIFPPYPEPKPKPEQKPEKPPAASTQLVRSENAPQQPAQAPHGKNSNKSIGSILLAVGTLIMLVCMIAAVEAHGSAKALAYVMLFGASLFSIGYLMLKDEKGKK